MISGFPLRVLTTAIAVACGLPAMPASAQPPPGEILGHVLTDVGTVPAPRSCGCVTSPFTVLTPRPGRGYGNGLAAPEGAAPASRFERKQQAAQIAEERANFRTHVKNALEGNPHEGVTLGMLFSEGKTVKRNDEEAFRWFRLAARHGHPDAYVQLGHRYSRGLGVAQNDRGAAYWFYMAASAGDRRAMNALGGLYAAGRGVAQDWSAALYWWEKAETWRFVGDAYACGIVVEQDYERALSYYRKGAEAHDAASSIQAGHILAEGCAARIDDEAAHDAYKRAADDGYPEAQIGLSTLYLEGRGVPMSPYQAYMWARLAELRLPSGTLRRKAAANAAAAARLMPVPERADAEKFVKSVIAAGAEPMNR